MKSLTKFGLIWLALLALPLHLAADDSFWICGEDISSRPSPFEWRHLQEEIPIYLAPGDAGRIYTVFLNRYLEALSPEDQSRGPVGKFIALQRSIIDGKNSAILVIKPGPMGDDQLLSGSATVFSMPCEDIEKQYLIDLAYLASAYRKVHDASFEALREQADLTIQERNRQYQNWFDNGLAMWPQETWFNGLFLGESDAVRPPRHQWVLLRPSVGLGGNASDGLDENNLDATLGVEIGGYVRYLEDDYSSYWGVSLLATLGEDAGEGYGVLLRYDQYVLGYTRRKEDRDLGIADDTEYVYIGVDLYNLVHEKKQAFRDYRRKVRENFERFAQEAR